MGQHIEVESDTAIGLLQVKVAHIVGQRREEARRLVLSAHLGEIHRDDQRADMAVDGSRILTFGNPAETSVAKLRSGVTWSISWQAEVGLKVAAGSLADALRASCRLRASPLAGATAKSSVTEYRPSLFASRPPIVDTPATETATW